MIPLKDKIIYVKKSARSFLRQPGFGVLYASLKYYPRWKKYLSPEKSSLSEQLPWITFPAIDRLEQIIEPDMEVFEYGSGGSTLFWASRVKSVVSIEHDKGWFENMQGLLQRGRFDNVKNLLIEPQYDTEYSKKKWRNPDDYISSGEHYKGMNFENYVRSIDAFPDQHFNVIVVDGRARPSCIKHSLPKLKRYGWLIVDNSERSYYLEPFQFDRSGWKIITFEGPIPFGKEFSRTTFFQKLQ